MYPGARLKPGLGLGLYAKAVQEIGEKLVRARAIVSEVTAEAGSIPNY